LLFLYCPVWSNKPRRRYLRVNRVYWKCGFIVWFLWLGTLINYPFLLNEGGDHNPPYSLKIQITNFSEKNLYICSSFFYFCFTAYSFPMNIFALVWPKFWFLLSMKIEVFFSRTRILFGKWNHYKKTCLPTSKFKPVKII
jgi:hypothetical protein